MKKEILEAKKKYLEEKKERKAKQKEGLKEKEKEKIKNVEEECNFGKEMEIEKVEDEIRELETQKEIKDEIKKISEKDKKNE